MAREEKPYRVYRGGRVRGGVPLRTKPAPRDGTDGGDDRSRYRGPSKPARERKRWGWGRRIGVALAALVLLLIVWSVAGYLSFSGGVSKANKRVRRARTASASGIAARAGPIAGEGAGDGGAGSPSRSGSSSCSSSPGVSRATSRSAAA